MPVMVLAWVLGVSMFCYGWLLAITEQNRKPLYAALALAGLAVCVIAAVVAEGQHLITY